MGFTRTTTFVETLELLQGGGARIIEDGREPARGIRFRKTAIPGVVLVEPQVHKDDRGFFLETYHQRKYVAGGIDATFVQDNHSRSTADTLRGLHAQIDHPQGKLLRVIEGAIFDVAVDVRDGSPDFWFGIELSASNHRQLYVPPGLLHGFWVLSHEAQVEYKCTDFWDPDDEVSVRWDDPDLAVHWPGTDPNLSKRDRDAKFYAELRQRLSRSAPYRGPFDV